jgi:hypothetical protein
MCFGSESTRKGLSFCAPAATGNRGVVVHLPLAGCLTDAAIEPAVTSFAVNVMLDALFHAPIFGDFNWARLVDHDGGIALPVCYSATP